MSNVFGVFQLVGGIIMSVGYIPQIAQILRTKSSEGLNIKSFGNGKKNMKLYQDTEGKELVNWRG